MDTFILQAIACELDVELRAMRLDKVVQPAPLGLVLSFRGVNRTGRRLLISAEADAPRLHFTSETPPPATSMQSFAQSLRRHLIGCRVMRIASGEWERVVQISLEHPGGALFALMIEVMGRWSNVILLEGSTGRILDAMRMVVPEQSPRPVLRGEHYNLPPAQRKLAPEEVDETVLRRLLGESDLKSASSSEVAKRLVRAIGGLSPRVAADIARAVGESWPALWKTFETVMASYRDRRFCPAIVLDDRGHPAVLTALGKGLGREQVRFFHSMNEAAEVFYKRALHDEAIGLRRNALRRMLQRLKKKSDRTLAAVRRDLEEAEGAEDARRLGDLLLSHLGRLPEQAEVFRAEENGHRIEVPLDPRISVSANAQRLFRRYKKLKRLQIVGQERLEKVEDERTFLEGLLYDLEEASTAADLDGIETAMAAGGYLRRHSRKGHGKRPRRPVVSARSYRRFRGSGGWEIFVGKNALGNEALLRQVGQPGDTWLHAQGIPGSHVLLRLPRAGDDVPEATALVEAAALAAYFSRGRADSKLRVDYLPFRALRRPRGARPGQVIFTGQRTIVVRPEEGGRLAERLEEVE